MYICYSKYFVLSLTVKPQLASHKTVSMPPQSLILPIRLRKFYFNFPVSTEQLLIAIGRARGGNSKNINPGITLEHFAPTD